MSNFTAYSDDSWLAGLDGFLAKTVKSGSLPYSSPAPKPRNRNAVTFRPLDDANAQLLELKAASENKRPLWIFGADAEFLGLHLARADGAFSLNGLDASNPVPVFASLSPKAKDAQLAYLLDQFSPESLERAASLAHTRPRPGTPGARRRFMARRLLKTVYDYRSGVPSREEAGKNTRNIKANSVKDTQGFNAASSLYRAYTANSGPEQKSAFDTLRRYFITQYTRGSLSAVSTVNLNDFSLLARNARLFSQTLFRARDFVNRMASPGFSRARLSYSKDNTLESVPLTKGVSL
jgi:hypothetical protein